ncbi:sulfurtransferase [Photobacterium lutimaris]|uniref:Sulfurtransferase n=1 Tax=Photobacterium lutimaris TaxID=388278 RepID=A0A2T3J098_9GAMM|nr:rhodanese-like domain-containing protein [Photobacterium lutimaris]PSU34363.1 sulfurtransferase [Photobacterium lutimaris]TDR75959.1 thiosulfate/3-mercaptopyruvate sulfurtransferase [Photobacterium lutimaris]
MRITFILLFVALLLVPSTASALSVQQLANQLESTGLIIYDGRSKKEYDTGHIPGAISFPFGQAYFNKDRALYVKGRTQITSLLREKGLKREKQVIVYDNGDLVSAARLFWILTLYGHDNVTVFEPGYSAWSQSQPIERQAQNIKRSKFTPNFDASVYASTTVVKLATYSKNYTILDVRTLDEYQGRKSMSSTYGRIPSALHFPISSLVKDEAGQQVVKSNIELASSISHLERDKKYITYCNLGRNSTLGFYVLKRAGFDVALYDGSWIDWTTRQLPVELERE